MIIPKIIYMIIPDPIYGMMIPNIWLVQIIPNIFPIYGMIIPNIWDDKIPNSYDYSRLFPIFVGWWFPIYMIIPDYSQFLWDDKIPNLYDYSRLFPIYGMIKFPIYDYSRLFPIYSQYMGWLFPIYGMIKFPIYMIIPDYSQYMGW